MKNLKLILPLLAALFLGLSFIAPAPAKLARVEKSGSLSSWRLEMDGTLYLGLESGEAQTMWFRTPPDRSEVFSIEEMLLQVALRTGDEATLTLVGEKEPGQDGKSTDKAFELVTISRP